MIKLTKEQFLDEMYQYVCDFYVGAEKFETNPTPLRVLSSLYSKRAEKLFNRRVIDLLQDDKRFFIYLKRSGARWVAPAKEVKAFVGDEPKLLRMLFREKAEYETT